jgi:hypothetical protein
MPGSSDRQKMISIFSEIAVRIAWDNPKATSQLIDGNEQNQQAKNQIQQQVHHAHNLA